MRLPFWADREPCDLLKVVPGAEAVVGEAADVVLYTPGSTVPAGQPGAGLLRHPTVWNDDRGLVACFGDRERLPMPEQYGTEAPIVRCTLLEALRCGWLQGWAMVVNGERVWEPGHDEAFWSLVGHQRGWAPLARSEVDEFRADVVARLAQTSERVVQLVDFTFPPA